MPPPDPPKREWITSVTAHSVRIDDNDPNSQFPSLVLYYRCEWCDPKDNVSGRTWETEYVFGEDSEILLDYCRRHHRGIRASIKRAQGLNPNLDMDMEATKYLFLATLEYNKAHPIHSPVSRATNPQRSVSDDDEGDDVESTQDECDTQSSSQHYNERTKEELEQMFSDAGGLKQPTKSANQRQSSKRKADTVDDEAPAMHAQAVDSISIKCGELVKKFEVDAVGRLLKDIRELGEEMGIVGNADMLLFTGRYMADRVDDHFVVSLDILNAECTLTLTGQSAEDSSVQNQAKFIPKTSYIPPYPDGTENTFMDHHREVLTLTHCAQSGTNMHW